MAKEKTYIEKLRDPQWQKRRLEIFERDIWMCSKCGNMKETLHVHHRRYDNKYRNPWEYPDNLLVTLCETCHKSESAEIWEAAIKDLSNALKEKFFVDDIQYISNGFKNYEMGGPSEACASAIEFSLKDTDLSNEIVKRYFDYLKEKYQSQYLNSFR